MNTTDPILLKFNELFDARFDDDCPTCGLQNCICDEETMELMERERGE